MAYMYSLYSLFDIELIILEYYPSFRAYDLLELAAEMDNTKAMEHIAEAYLFGIHMPQNISRARIYSEQLAERGSPRGQMVQNLTSYKVHVVFSGGSQ